ncbi:hypothetical protein [Erythrobacter westpacificensis]
MAQKFTRSEFYDLIWSKPLTRLAKEFGVSDVALHKLCRKHDIPKPATSSRAKIATGKMVERPPLPALKKGVSDMVCISGSALRTEPETIATIRDEATSRASKFNAEKDAKEHPVVTRSMAKLRKARPDDRGLVRLTQSGLIDIAIAPASIDRIELALNRIVSAAEIQGFDLTKVERRVAFTDGNVVVPFRVVEKTKRAKHEPTAKERAKQAEAQRTLEQRWGKAGLGPAPSSGVYPRLPKYDYSPSGIVSFEFDLLICHNPSARRTFNDGRNQRLEEMANEIAGVLAGLTAAKIEDERRDEEAEKRSEDNHRRRIEHKRRAYIEDRRSATLEKILAIREQRDRLRRLVADISEDTDQPQSQRTSAFQIWLKEKLAEAEEAASGMALDRLLETENLFGGNDDKGFSPHKSSR